jgi:hypothetical protein
MNDTRYTTPYRKRLYLEFNPAVSAILDSLMAETEAPSYAALISDALRLYKGILEEDGQTARLVAERRNGTTAIVRVFR